MEHRTKLEFRVQETVIIVISTLQAIENRAPDQDGPVSSSPNTNGPQDPNDGSTSMTDYGRSTLYQRESVRTRQKERRQAKRSGKRVQKHFNTADGEQVRTPATGRAALDDAQTDFTGFLILIWIFYDETGTTRREIPHQRSEFVKTMDSNSLQETLENYLNQTTAKLKSPADMESYLKAKCREIVLLRRQIARVSSADKYHHDKLGRLYQEQAQHDKLSEKWRQIENGPKAKAIFQLKVVLHAKSVLPQILASQKSHFRSIEQRCARTVERLTSMEIIEQRKNLVYNVAQYEAWTSTVFLLSHAREDLLRQLEEAKSELAAFDRGLPEQSTLKSDGSTARKEIRFSPSLANKVITDPSARS
ncbi:hypothetical protein J7T55_000385 [Diaporthe amygdali]|uniref:uncharacterized protein n=1 Tax=Phomopsis amygdali TaxID=1214568 RepID=UPI0022FE97BD|nr:uncharacterized protein J7T55_000385 [Diaporthe amygdali]KAJ0109460.1 hypothetical protein J7T55_000385 [Diaporthe amygdali]